MIKVYFHLCLEGFSNCYVVGNEKTKQALIIDPGTVTKEMIMQIEQNHFSLEAVLITHNHLSHHKGFKTLRKSINLKFIQQTMNLQPTIQNLKRRRNLKIIGTNVGYLSVPGHTADSMVYKIGQILFTGDALTAGLLGSTNNSYAERILKTNIKTKILSQNDELIIMPGHGPPSTIKSEKQFNTQVYSNKSTCTNVRSSYREFITA